MDKNSNNFYELNFRSYFGSDELIWWSDFWKNQDETEIPASFHIFKFQLVILFFLFHTCSNIFQLFFGRETTVNRKIDVVTKRC